MRCLHYALSLTLLCSAAFAAQGAEYKLGIEDKLRIKVYEWPDLTGDFAVGPSGSVSMPLLGEIPAEGLSPAELAQSISQRLREQVDLAGEPSTTVEVAEFRPFFITGDVQNPGEYAYRPDMNVIEAVAIAGGQFRLTDPGLLRLERDAITARGDLRLLDLRTRQLLARRARLNAELANATEIELPPELLEDADEPAVAQLIREEELILEANRNALEQQTANLNERSDLYRQEIEALKRQIETEEEQAESLRAELEDVESLVSRGLAAAPRQLALERTAAQIEGDKRELETLILRARQSISQTEQQIVDLQNERRNRILTESQEVRTAYEEALDRAETARRLVFEAEVTAPLVMGERLNAGRTEPSYAILRQNGEETETVQAAETTLVRPGDVIRVTRALQSAAPPEGAAGLEPLERLAGDRPGG